MVLSTLEFKFCQVLSGSIPIVTVGVAVPALPCICVFFGSMNLMRWSAILPRFLTIVAWNSMLCVSALASRRDLPQRFRMDELVPSKDVAIAQRDTQIKQLNAFRT